MPGLIQRVAYSPLHFTIVRRRSINPRAWLPHRIANKQTPNSNSHSNWIVCATLSHTKWRVPVWHAACVRLFCFVFDSQFSSLGKHLLSLLSQNGNRRCESLQWWWKLLISGHTHLLISSYVSHLLLNPLTVSHSVLSVRSTGAFKHANWCTECLHWMLALNARTECSHSEIRLFKLNSSKSSTF